jgi:hypothetical protein
VSYLALTGASDPAAKRRFRAFGELRELRWDSWGVLPNCCPTDSSIRQWIAPRPPQATERALPSGTIIRALSPPYLLATKLEAFKGRGNGDFLGSRDFADIIALVDGREELVDEVAAADQDVRQYLAHEVSLLLAAPRIADGLFGAMRADPASQQRAESVVLPALRSIASAA